MQMTSKVVEIRDQTCMVRNLILIAFKVGFIYCLVQDKLLIGTHTGTMKGFVIVFACTDTWKDTMISRHNNQEERILSLEHSLLVTNNTIQGSQTLFLGLQAEHRKLDEISTQKNYYPQITSRGRNVILESQCCAVFN